MQTVPNAFKRTIADALTAVGGLLENVSLKLFQNDITPSGDTVVGDLTEATFTGYADVDYTDDWLAPYTDALGNAHVALPSAQFLQTAATVSNIVYGYYVVETGSGALVWAERFDEPVAFAAAATAKTVVPDFQYSGK